MYHTFTERSPVYILSIIFLSLGQKKVQLQHSLGIQVSDEPADYGRKSTYVQSHDSSDFFHGMDLAGEGIKINRVKYQSRSFLLIAVKSICEWRL